MKRPREIIAETNLGWDRKLGHAFAHHIEKRLAAAGYVIVEKDELEALYNYSNALAGTLKPKAKP